MRKAVAAAGLAAAAALAVPSSAYAGSGTTIPDDDTPHCATLAEAQSLFYNETRQRARNVTSDDFTWSSGLSADFVNTCPANTGLVIYYHFVQDTWKVTDYDWVND